ncbi:MAG: MBL fold metallo-hydrolase [bacterium]
MIMNEMLWGKLVITRSVQYIILALLAIGLQAGAVSRCSQQNIKLQVLGSGGPELDDQRASSSYLIWKDDQAIILVDVGSGSSFNFEKSGAKIEDLQAVLLTHLHVDHSVELPSFIKASYFTSRVQDLAVYGPDKNALMPSTSDYVKRLMGHQGAFKYLHDYVDQNEANDFHIVSHNIPIEEHQLFSTSLTPDIKISAIPVHHGPVAALAWRVDVGDCSISFSGDMNNDYHTLEKLALNSNILVLHNAIPEEASAAAANLHMKPSQMAEIAQKAQPKMVVLSHFMNRTANKQSQTLQIMRSKYKGPVLMAKDLDVFFAQESSNDK